MEPTTIDPTTVGNNISTWTQNNGLAVVLLFIGIAITVYFARWIGAYILLPLKDAAIGHLQKTDSTLETVKTTLQSMDGRLSSIEGHTEKLVNGQDDLRVRIGPTRQ